VRSSETVERLFQRVYMSTADPSKLRALLRAAVRMRGVACSCADGDLHNGIKRWMCSEGRAARAWDKAVAALVGGKR
jgi:hypothetical protein